MNQPIIRQYVSPDGRKWTARRHPANQAGAGTGYPPSRPDAIIFTCDQETRSTKFTDLTLPSEEEFHQMPIAALGELFKRSEAGLPKLGT